MKSKKIISCLMALSILGTSSLMFGGTAKATSITPSNNNVLARAPKGYQNNSINIVLKPQEKEHWCWAACVQAVLRNLGVNVSQTDIVTYIYGSPVDNGGGTDDMMRAIRHFAGDSKCRRLTSSGPLSFEQVKSEIDAGRPIIASIYVGDLHHAVVIYGYEIQADGQKFVDYKSSYTTSISSKNEDYNNFLNVHKWDYTVYGAGGR